MGFFKKLQLNFIQEILEFNERLVFDRRCKKALKSIFTSPVKTVFDVGANKGQSIKLFSSWFPKATIYSFEPNSNLFNKLTTKYGKKENIKIFQNAISESDGEMTFYQNMFDTSSTLEEVNPDSAYLEKKAKILGVKKEELIVESYPVKVKQLNTIIKELDLSKVDFIKIDVEGHELPCLRGLFNDLTADVKCVQIEAHSNDLYKNQHSKDEINDLFRANGFINSNEVKHGFGGFSDIIFWKP